MDNPWNENLEECPKNTLVEIRHNGSAWRGTRYANTTYFVVGMGYLAGDAWRLIKEPQLDGRK